MGVSKLARASDPGSSTARKASPGRARAAAMSAAAISPQGAHQPAPNSTTVTLPGVAIDR